MNIRMLMLSITATSLMILSSAAQAEELIYSGFMSDYSQLQRVTDGSANYRYIAPGSEEKLAKYWAVMIDQPEIFIAVDSKYRGAKPRQLEALSEAIREGIVAAVSEDIFVVDRPGENVMYLALAVSNLKLTKGKKKVLGYTPVGLVTGAVKGAATTDIAKKANLQGLVLELEGFDSVTGERLVAIIDSRSSDKQNPASWEDLEQLATLYGERLRCRLKNARLPAGERTDCLGD